MNVVDRAAFWTSVAAGLVAAVAGTSGWKRTTVVAGCIAAIAPIVNRVAAAHQHKALLAKLGPRSLSSAQREHLINSLRAGPPFKLWVAHNRHEAEPSQFHKQIFDALKDAGLDAQYFGGMNNNTVGVEISGAPSPEKSRLMSAFDAAEIPFLNVHFTDDVGQHWGLGVWIGVNPGASTF